jgi:hypothetical protein
MQLLEGRGTPVPYTRTHGSQRLNYWHLRLVSDIFIILFETISVPKLFIAHPGDGHVFGQNMYSSMCMLTNFHTFVRACWYYYFMFCDRFLVPAAIVASLPARLNTLLYIPTTLSHISKVNLGVQHSDVCVTANRQMRNSRL